MGQILAIFNLSGKTADEKDKLQISTKEHPVISGSNELGLSVVVLTFIYVI